MTKQKKIVEKPITDGHLAEIFQANRTEFALCRYDTTKDKLIQCHQFVHCRDFIGDALVGVEDNRDMGVWGFKYFTNYPRPDPENSSILVRLENEGALKNLQDNFSILKDIEDNLGWGISMPEIVDYPGKYIVLWFLGDIRWQRSAIAVSLYTYLIKCLTYPFKDKKNWMQEIKALGTGSAYEKNPDVQYMDPDYLKFLFVNFNEITSRYMTYSGFTNQKSLGISTIHNYIGFVSMKKLIYKKEKSSLYDTHALNGWKAAA